MKKRAGVVARVSTAEQATEGYSMDAQIQKGKAYAALHDWEVVDLYEDGGVSGAKSLEERPEGARFIRDARQNRVDVAIFTKLDRFSRSTKKALNDFDLLDELGVEVVFIEDNLDTTTPMGRAMRDLMLTFATLERETIRDRNMQGRYQKASTGGGWATGRVPFGFEVDDDGNLIVNETEAAAIRLAFELRAKGKPYREVANALNAEGHQPRGKRDEDGNPIPLQFTSGSISHYVKQTYYRGDPIVRHLAPNDQSPPEPFEFPVPAIVPSKLWAKANGDEHGRLGEPHRTYGLSGRLWHEHADFTQSTMFGHARKAGNKGKGDFVRFYRCAASRNTHTRPQDPDAMVCDGFGELQKKTTTGVQADWVEARILLFILDKLSKPEDLDALLQKAEVATLGDALDEDADELRIRLAKLGVKVERWTEQYAEGLISKPQRDERLAKLTEQREDLERKLAALQHAAAQRANASDLVEAILFGGEREDYVDSDFSDLDLVFSAGEAMPPRGTSAWWQALSAHASKTLNEPTRWGRFPNLPNWVVAEVKSLSEALDIHVVLHRSTDPRRPRVKVAFAPPSDSGVHLGNGASRRTPSDLAWVYVKL